MDNFSKHLEKGTFISSVSPYPEEEYYLGKSTWSATASDWDQRFEVGDVVANPSGSWTPSTAEAYIDQQVGILNTNLANETIGRQTGDRNLQTQLQSEMNTRADQDANLNALINAGIREGEGVQFDTVPTQNSANGITSGGMYSTLRDSNIGFVDDEPTPGSNNLVKSSGVAKNCKTFLTTETYFNRLVSNIILVQKEDASAEDLESIKGKSIYISVYATKHSDFNNAPFGILLRDGTVVERFNTFETTKVSKMQSISTSTYLSGVYDIYVEYNEMDLLSESHLGIINIYLNKLPVSAAFEYVQALMSEERNNVNTKLDIVENLSVPYNTLNLYDYNKRTDGVYIVPSTGKPSQANNFSISDYIKIKSGVNYTIKNFTYAQINPYAFYDKDLNYISGNAGDSTSGTLTITIPNNAEYIRLSIVYGQYASTKFMFYEGSTDKDYMKFLPYVPSAYIKPTVYVGVGKDYTSILEALLGTEDFVKVVVTAGEYNIQNEYKLKYGSTYFEDYDGYLNSNNKFDRGYHIGNKREIIFEAGSKVIYDVDTTNTKVRTYFSPFNPTGNCEIVGLNLVFNNQCRYAVHDDFVENEGTTVYRNCIFEGRSYNGDTIGGGLGARNVIIIENCIFIGNTSPTEADVSYHHTGFANGGECKVFVRDCYGENNCKFKWYGSSNKITKCFVSGCRFKTITTLASEATPHDIENMNLTKWNNDEFGAV